MKNMVAYDSNRRLTASAVSILCNILYGEEFFDVSKCIGSHASLFRRCQGLNDSREA